MLAQIYFFNMMIFLCVICASILVYTLHACLGGNCLQSMRKVCIYNYTCIYASTDTGWKIQ